MDTHAFEGLKIDKIDKECKKCTRNAQVNLKYLEPLCNKCFCEIIEKRIRRYARQNKLFMRGDRILFIDRLCLFLTKNIIKGLPVKIFYRKYLIADILNSGKEIRGYVKTKNINKVVIPWTLDDEVAGFLYNVFNNQQSYKQYPPINNNGFIIVWLLLNVSNKEAELYSKIKNLKFCSDEIFPDVKCFLDSLENLYPDIKFGTLKSKALVSKLQ